MAWISAALAFAITMLMLSMVTSVFVETFHRFLGLREKGLWLLLGQYFDRVLAPILTARGVKPEDFKKSFLDLMTLNRAPAGTLGKGDITADSVWQISRSNDEGFDKSMFNKWWSGRRLSNLSAEQFMSRLGGSPLGEHIEAAKGASDDLLQDLSERFAAFSDEASEFFGRRARLTSVLVSIPVAYLMYVHPLELFRTYMANPAVTESVIQQQEEVLASFDKVRVEDEAKKLKAAEDKVKEKSAANAPASDKEAAEKELEAVRTSFDDAREKAQATIDELSKKGVPIGWTKERMDAAGFHEGQWLGLPWPNLSREGNQWRTLLWLLLGGLLVGLGGPFWYDIVNSLSNVRNLVGGAKAISEPATGKEGVNPKLSEFAAAVDRFKIASAGRIAAKPQAQPKSKKSPA
jgi:hypothetical protein